MRKAKSGSSIKKKEFERMHALFKAQVDVPDVARLTGRSQTIVRLVKKMKNFRAYEADRAERSAIIRQKRAKAFPEIKKDQILASLEEVATLQAKVQASFKEVVNDEVKIQGLLNGIINKL